MHVGKQKAALNRRTAIQDVCTEVLNLSSYVFKHVIFFFIFIVVTSITPHAQKFQKLAYSRYDRKRKKTKREVSEVIKACAGKWDERAKSHKFLSTLLTV